MIDTLLFAINAVLPVVALVAIGYILKRVGLMTPDFARAGNKLVFRLFLPVMLFLNVYNIDAIGDIDLGYVGYVLLFVLIFFLLSLPTVTAITRDGARRGALLQGAVRGNFALIGIPLATSLAGEEGAAIAALLSAALIPLYNILAVVSLTIFRRDGRVSVRRILGGIVKNPLIGAIALGIVTLAIRAVFERTGVTFRLTDIAPLYKMLGWLRDLATPLSLLVLGAQFEFSHVAALRRELLCGVGLKLVAMPLLGLGCAWLLGGTGFGAGHYAAFVAAFATPVAVSSVPMAQEMEGDTALAGQLVVWTTIGSAAAVFIAACVLRAAGLL